jgi:hypothetical protein
VAKSHIWQKKRAGAGIPTNVFDARKIIGTINRKYVTDVRTKLF